MCYNTNLKFVFLYIKQNWTSYLLSLFIIIKESKISIQKPSIPKILPNDLLVYLFNLIYASKVLH